MQLFSNDEYVDQRKIQFKLEGLYIILGLLALNALRGIIFGDFSGHVILSLGVVLFYAVYFMLREVFTGLEYPNVSSHKRYKKKRKEILAYSMTFLVIYLFLNIGHKLLFKPEKEWVDIIGTSILFIILWSTINYISLKISYKKNKEISDD